MDINKIENDFDAELILSGYKDKYNNPYASMLWISGYRFRESIKFLCEEPGKKPNRILDIGSGLGHFCIKGGLLYPLIKFVGVELDQNRYNCSIDMALKMKVHNTSFINANFKDIDLIGYSGIFVYNPFNMGGYSVYNNGDYKIENVNYDIINTKIRSFISEMKEILLERLYKLPKGTKVVLCDCDYGLSKYYSKSNCDYKVCCYIKK